MDRFSIKLLLIFTIIVVILFTLVVYFRAKPQAEPLPEKWLGYYMQTHEGIPCIWNYWQGRPDTIASCFNTPEQAVSAFLALRDDKEEVEEIINATKKREVNESR